MLSLVFIAFLAQLQYGIYCQNDFRIELSLYTKNTSTNLNCFDKLSDIDGFCVSSSERSCLNYFIINSYDDEIESEWVDRARHALFSNTENANVFVVNWLRINNYGFFSFEDAARNVDSVSQQLYDYIMAFASNYDFSINDRIINIHCIGHGLGAHVCGLTGKKMHDCNLRFSRITGLDPGKFKT